MHFHEVFLGSQHEIWSKQHNGTVSLDHCDVDFSLPTLSEKFIYDTFQDAVLLLLSGNYDRYRGTGYLIDPWRGYVLTAAHVVKASIENSLIAHVTFFLQCSGKACITKGAIAE